jgi:hypothetical protein
MHHTPGIINSTMSLLHCDAPTPGGLPCNGPMRLVSEAVDPGGVARETWECMTCHAREFHTVVTAFDAQAEEERRAESADEPEFFCTFCHNPYEQRSDDELHACEPCTVWYRMNSGRPN